MVSLGFGSVLCLFDHFFSFAYLQAPQRCSHSRIPLPSSFPFLPPSLPPRPPPPPPPPNERHTKLFLILNALPTPPSLPSPLSPFLTSAPPTSPHPPAQSAPSPTTTHCYRAKTPLLLLHYRPSFPLSLPPYFLATDLPPSTPTIWPVTHDDSLLSSKNAAAAPALPSFLPSLPPLLTS